MNAWVRKEENAPEHRQIKRETEEADKVKVAPGVIAKSVRRFRAEVIGPVLFLFCFVYAVVEAFLDVLLIVSW